MFDLGLIAINPDGSVDVCETLKDTEYAKLGPLKVPTDVSKQPSAQALEWHRLKLGSAAARAALMKKMNEAKS